MKLLLPILLSLQTITPADDLEKVRDPSAAKKPPSF